VDTPTPENQGLGSGMGSQGEPATLGKSHAPLVPDIHTHLAAHAEVCTVCVEFFSFRILAY